MKRLANAGARRALKDALRHMLRDGQSSHQLLGEGYGVSPKDMLRLRSTVRVPLRTDRRQP